MWSKCADSFKILHVVDNKVVNSEALTLFKNDFRKSIEPADKLTLNYSETNFEIESHEMFDALYTQAGEFVACTGIFKRAQWPTGMYRLLNRTYFNPSFRESHRFSFFASDYLLPGQVQRCKSPLNLIFVSRQGKNGGHFLKKLQARPYFKDRYEVSKDYIQVAPGMDDKCFQKILFHKNDPSVKFQLQAVDDLNHLPAGIKDVVL